MMIGLSVSLCIRDIVSGNVDINDVEYINGATSSKTFSDWREIARHYRQSYWDGFGKEAESVMWKLIRDGKIRQPRLEGLSAPNIAEGHWIEYKNA